MGVVLETFIQDRRVDGSFLELLRELENNSVGDLEALILALNPSANTMREVLRLAREIALRDRVSLSSVLQAEDLLILRSQQDLAPKEKQRKVKQLLERRRYPEKSRLEKEIRDLLKQLRRDFNLDLELPEELEGDSLSLQVSLRSSEQLIHLAESLRGASGDPRLELVFQKLLGA